MCLLSDDLKKFQRSASSVGLRAHHDCQLLAYNLHFVKREMWQARPHKRCLSISQGAYIKFVPVPNSDTRMVARHHNIFCCIFTLISSITETFVILDGEWYVLVPFSKYRKKWKVRFLKEKGVTFMSIWCSILKYFWLNIQLRHAFRPVDIMSTINVTSERQSSSKLRLSYTTNGLHCR